MTRKSFWQLRKSFCPVAQVICQDAQVILPWGASHFDEDSATRATPVLAGFQTVPPARCGRSPDCATGCSSSPFCPPLSRVRRQCAWRCWRTSGRSERVLSVYDRPCPPLSSRRARAGSDPGGPRAVLSANGQRLPDARREAGAACSVRLAQVGSGALAGTDLSVTALGACRSVNRPLGPAPWASAWASARKPSPWASAKRTAQNKRGKAGGQRCPTGLRYRAC